MSEHGHDGSDVASRVTKWLKKESGYPLEMMTAAALSKAGFSVVQGDYFADEEDNKEVFREIDVTGYISHSGNNVQISAGLMVECKSQTSPWLLFTYPHGYSDTLQVVRRCATSVPGNKILSKLQFEEAIRRLPLFPFLPNAGYSVATMREKKDEKDVSYPALMSVCKASIAHVGRLLQRGVIAFDWPTIVIRAPLLECHLDENHEVVVKEIESGTLVWRNPVINSATIVDIYTLNAFEARVPMLCQAAKTFAERAWLETQS
jgi:hypothetical protein